MTKKRPFYEVVSKLLYYSGPGIQDPSLTMMLLGILQDSEMPTAAAHKIAKDHADLAIRCSQANQARDVVDFIQSSLDNLRSRRG